MSLATLAPAYADQTGQASVTDGDTIKIHGERIRLLGIDAPESGQTCDRGGKTYRCGQNATLALDAMISGQAVNCVELDRYGRMIGRCTAGGVDLGEWMVFNGLAVAYYRYSDEYADAEQSAKQAPRGIWRGRFVMPWDWRKGEQLAVSPQPGECAIKGNINREGERIYHVPGGRGYEATRINPTKGERWFCTEDDAREAGWRLVKK